MVLSTLQPYGEIMFKKIGVNIVKRTRPVYISALGSTLFFSVGVHNYDTHATPLDVHLVYTTIFFLCMWLACRLISSSLSRRRRLEGIPATTKNHESSAFVIYLETIKHVVGVSFTLFWIAGVLSCWDYLGGRGFIIPFIASLAVSLIAFLVTYGVSLFVDSLRWPDTKE